MTFMYLIVFALTVSIVHCETCRDEKFEHSSAEWMHHGGWIGIAFLSIICYWGLSTISQQFLIPALNVICEKFNLSDDVAGSTVMAIGMESSQFFQTIASLFITKSSLGIGSAIGSGFFSPLCICAGAVLCSPDGTVKLEWRIIVRECLFYLASLMVLIYSLEGSLIDAVYQFIGQQQQLGNCLVVHLGQCIFIISIYIIYIGVCSYYETIVKYICPIRMKYGLEFDDQLDALLPWNPTASFTNMSTMKRNEEWSVGRNESTSSKDSIKRLMPVVDRTPAFGHFDDNELILNGNPSPYGANRLHTIQPNTLNNSNSNSNSNQSKNATNETNSGTGSINPPISPFKIWTPWGETNINTDIFRIEDTNQQNMEPDLDVCIHEYVDDIDRFQCYLYKRSRFYSKIRYSQHKWQLRWFSLDSLGFHYCINREHPGVNVKLVNIFQADELIIVDEDKYIFKIMIQGQGHEFQANDENIYSALIYKLKQRIAQYSQYAKATRSELANKAKAALLAQQKIDKIREPPTVISTPLFATNNSNSAIYNFIRYCLILFYHYCLLPFKYILYYTTFDIRQYKYQQNLMLYTTLSLLSCLFWLSGLSIVMVISLDLLASFIGISSSIMGLIFSAIVTSVPNIIASVIASKQGMGTSAVSNAFGCSLFSIFIGLGMPLLICIGLNHGLPYRDLKDEGIILTVGILIITIVLFLLLMFINTFVLKRWMGIFFILYYITYVVYAIIFTTTPV